MKRRKTGKLNDTRVGDVKYLPGSIGIVPIVAQDYGVSASREYYEEVEGDSVRLLEINTKREREREMKKRLETDLNRTNTTSFHAGKR